MKRAVAAALVVTAGLAAYHGSFRGAMVFDDAVLLTRDWSQGLPPLRELVADPRPLHRASFYLDHALGGLDVRVYHAVNLVVHLLAALALFDVVRRTLVLRNMRPQASLRVALSVALLWVVHPLNTQAVTYIVQRSESLMGLFALLCLLAVIRSTESPRPLGWQLAAACAFTFSVLSKEVGAMVPLVVLVYDRVFLAGSFRDLPARRGALYLGFVPGLVWFALAHASSLLPGGSGGADVTAGFWYRGVTPLEYLGSQPGVLLHYLRLAVWPHPLVLDYAWPVARTAAEILLPGAVVVALLAGSVAALRRRPGLGFLGLSFFLVLAPTSSFVPIKDLAFEHRMYLPLAAVLTLIVLGAREVLGRTLPERTRRAAGAALLVAATAALGARTVARNADYARPAALWESVVKERPENARAWARVGQARLDEGLAEEARVCFERALSIAPETYGALDGLGLIAFEAGSPEDLERSLEWYRRAAASRPHDPAPLHHAGRVHMKAGNYERAKAAFDAALALDPKFSPAFEGLAASWQGLAVRHAQRGRLDLAEEALQAGIARVRGSGADTATLEAVLADVRAARAAP